MDVFYPSGVCRLACWGVRRLLPSCHSEVLNRCGCVFSLCSVEGLLCTCTACPGWELVSSGGLSRLRPPQGRGKKGMLGIISLPLPLPLLLLVATVYWATFVCRALYKHGLNEHYMVLWAVLELWKPRSPFPCPRSHNEKATLVCLILELLSKIPLPWEPTL